MATTPPPHAIRTPPTPRHGARFDSFEPYSTRHSTRLANRRVPRYSPTPSTPDSPRSPNDTDILTDANSRKRCPSETDSFLPSQSTQASPTRISGRKIKATQLRTQKHSLFDNSTGQTDQSSQSMSDAPHSLSSMDTTLTANMLPTPAKTPRKKAAPDGSAVARTLFRSNTQSRDPEMPTPKRQKGKKFKGFSLESFNAELENEGNDDIMIFTDSRDRIPQIHESADNPFVSRSNDSSDEVGGSHEAQRDEKVREAIHRDDGMLYVFRGKKIFRKFDSDTEEDDQTDRGLLSSRPDLLEGASVPNVRPLTRSSIKPRLLFPNASRRVKARGCSRFGDAEKPTNPEEICEIDVQDQINPNPDRPHPNNEGVPATPPPKTTLSTPSTPLTGGRSLRSHTKEGRDDIGSPSKHSSVTAIRVSPFDRWTRIKSQASPATLRKRVGTVSSDSVEPAMKKSRSK
ncbi:hypothetical protein AJ78_01857 [Emergomyces pasteurianus Ep9510]|uniref:Uncharacterized protein n=1 Tax=Emergomyces pasteurianus Ep9510 TaxID=1447872 RepID=A0A1J9QS50_9EURO|nr:hypothetical protein AJ78_01857 [Emergomyces pasteurianus Ep9510]